MTDIPHFEYPFRLGANGHVASVEQDEIADVASCVVVLCKTPPGARLDLPNFGVPEQVFQEKGVNSNALLPAIRSWEPRAEYDLTLSEIVDLAQNANINVNARPDA
jgi:phage baseplate assembly protein W